MTLLTTLESTLLVLRTSSLGAVPSEPRASLGGLEGGGEKWMRGVEGLEREVGRLFREKQTGKEGSEIVLGILGAGN